MIDPIELHALADGELSGEEAARLRDQLRTDAEASAEFSTIQNLKDFVSQNAMRHPSEEAWLVCAVRIKELDRTRRVEAFVGRYSWGLTALVFVLILGGRYAVQGVRGDSARTADLLPLFSRVTESPVPAGRNTADMDRWLNSLLGRARQAVDPNRIVILGGATGITPVGQVTRLDLQDGKGQLNLMIVPGQLHLEDTAPLPGDPSVYAGELDGLNCVAWTADGYTLLLRGPRTADQLQFVASKITVRP